MLSTDPAAARGTNHHGTAASNRQSSDDGSVASRDATEEESENRVTAARSKTRSELECLFVDLYPTGHAEEDGLKTSRNERLSKGYESITLTYGEVSAVGVR